MADPGVLSGEIVPGLQAADAVANGTVEMCHMASYYYVGKDPSSAFGTAIPFGLDSRPQDAWLFQAAGRTCSTISTPSTT